MKTNKIKHIESSGFKTPTDYFETFDDKIFDKLKNNTPINHVNKTGFKIPNDYFESLDDKIFNNIENKKTATKVIPLFRKKTILFTSSIAAAVTILFSLSVLESKPTFDSLDTETINNYILTETASATDIASLFSEDNEIDTNLFSNQNLDNESIEDYLLNYTDFETLIIE